MKKLLGFLVLSFLPCQAHAVCNGLISQEVQPFAFENLTVSTTALGFTATVYAPAGVFPARMAIVTVETNPIRFRADGLAPSSSVGHLISATQQLEVCGNAAIQAFRMIRQASSDATVMITYYRVAQQ
jgi:hypothetical protein